MPVGQRLHLRLFLEGVEIPIIAANIQAQRNAPAAASIQIPANDYAMDLKPRTLVHLFAFDIYNGAPSQEQVSVGGPGMRVTEREEGIDPDVAGLFHPERFEETKDQEEIDIENENYKLIFGGEVVGIQFSKTPASRSVVLQCLDWSSYWDIAFQAQVSGMSLGGMGINAMFTGASASVFNSFLDGSGDIAVRLLNTPPRSYPELKGTLLGGITHIIEAIGGVYWGQRAIKGKNDFFSLAEMRLHLTQMVGADPYPDRSEVRLMNANGFGSLFSRSLSGLGKLVSIRQVLLALQRYIFHQIVPITTPRYIPPLYDPNLPRYETVGIEDDDATKPLARTALRVKARAEELKERVAASTDASTSRRQSNRRGGLTSELRQLKRDCIAAEQRARRVGIRNTGQLADFYSIPQVTRAFTTAGQKWDLILSVCRGSNARSASSPCFLPTEAYAQDVITTELDQIARMMQEVLTSQHRKRIQRATQQPDPPPRLFSQLYVPDVWMVAPPRCNVIFPELYSQFTYSRNFQQEVTRLLLRTHSAFYGSDVLFDNWYMAPSRITGSRTNRQIMGNHGGGDMTDTPAFVIRDFMDHELYSGIIPQFERMSDLNLHAIQGGVTTIDGVRVSYAQLACNHIFYQYRFKSRELQLSGKFNPYLALGFPAVVIDKYLPVDALTKAEYDSAVATRLAEAIREGEGDIDITGQPAEERQRIAEASQARVAEALGDILSKRPNTHYLGTPEGVAHVLEASQGGTTQVQMGYARTTNEKTEFMGDNVAAQPARARRTRNVRVTSTVAAIEAPELDTRGYRSGRIVEVIDITDQYTRRQRRLRSTNNTVTGQERYRGGTLLPLFIPGRAFTGRRRTGTRVLVGVSQPAASYGLEVVALVGSAGTVSSSDATSAEVLVAFRAFRLVEELGAYAAEEVELAPEDMTFPPWYGDHYRSQNIGGLYSWFFGTGAITDPLVVLRPGTQPPQHETPEERSNERALLVQFQQRISQQLAQIIAPTYPITPVGGVALAQDQLPQAGADSVPSLQGGELPGAPGNPRTDVENSIEGQMAGVPARSTIAEALEEVVKAYSQVKINNFDVHEFIKSYTWRPIASMLDLFGSASLEIGDDGSVVRGVEGFHSRAFGDFDDLRLLVYPGEGQTRTILGLSLRDPDESAPSQSEVRDNNIAARLDTRKEKRVHVMKYLYALMTQRGILG